MIDPTAAIALLFDWSIGVVLVIGLLGLAAGYFGSSRSSR